MDIEKRLHELGLSLPASPAPAGNYLPFRQAGKLIYLAGVLPIRDGVLTHTGAVGAEQTVAAAQEAARVCTLNALATLNAALEGDWNQLQQIVSVTGFVQGITGFSDSPAVLNGASDLLVAVLGERGKHARAAVSVNGLPRNASVEIQIIAERC